MMQSKRYQRTFLQWVALVGMTVGLGAGSLLAQYPSQSFGGLAGEKLMPATWRTISDQKGHKWNFQQNGHLGRSGASNNMWSSGMQLLVNQSQFYNYQPMMTTNGKEYVLSHAHPSQMMGMQVTRRIRVLEKEGVVSYLDIFHNPSPQAVTAFIEIRNAFATRMKNYVTNRGTQNATTFKSREYGVLVTPGSTSSSYKSVVISACSPGSTDKPTITSQNNMYQLGFHYNLTIPAGQSVCLLHVVGEAPKQKEIDGKAMVKLFKEFALKKFLKHIRPEYRGRIANFNNAGGMGALSLLTSTNVDGLGVVRARSDVLAMGAKTRLLGSASCAELTMKTSYGDADLAFEDIAALVGANRGRSSVSRVFLRDGQVFTGEITSTDLRFVLPSGARMDLDMQSLDRLVRGEAPGEGKWGPNVVALLETFEGDRIAMEGGAECQLRAFTPWGPVKFNLDDILWISPPEEEPVGHHIEFKDGSRFFAYLADEPVVVKSKLFGDQTLNSGRIRAIVTASLLRRAREKEKDAYGISNPEAESLQQPHLVLAGGQRLVGRVNAPYVSVMTNAELIEVPPENIRLMHSMREDGDFGSATAAPFQVDLWGGGVILGQIRETVLPVLVRGETWQVPLSDIVDIITPTPRISDETRQKIAALVRDLGNEDWEKRQSSTEELGEYGFMAKAILLEALKVTPDPEVRRRIEKILGEME